MDEAVATQTVDNFGVSTTYAPIILFAYKRVSHLNHLLESLLTNPEAADSDLIIYSDAPKKGDDAAVEEVRSYLRTIKGFHSVQLIPREVNYGLAKNIIAGVTESLERYGRAIIVEDDLVVSPTFLKYMNDALELYANEPRVASIHAYIYPMGDLAQDLPETFFLRGADCWGWATWKRAWDHFEQDGAKLLRQLIERDLLYDFDMGSTKGFSQMLLSQVNGGVDSWAIRWHASAFLKNQLTLYPKIPLVKNMGCDGSGTHSQYSPTDLELTLRMEPTSLEPMPIIESAAGKKAFSHYFSNELVRHLPQNGGGWFGNFTTYEDAQICCKGYDAPNILEKVKEAILRVKAGEAIYERDSVLFNKEEYQWPLVTSLLMSAADNQGNLSLIDFGGSLGSSYFQHRKLFRSLAGVAWNVVEQSHFVQVGQSVVAEGGLHFFETVQEALKNAPINPQLLLFSAVLHYLEKPLELLHEMVAHDLPYIVIDRTPVTRFATRVTVQKVPSVIYEASYPCWIFNEEELLKVLERKYKLLKVWPALDPAQGSFEFRGYLFKRKDLAE